MTQILYDLFVAPWGEAYFVKAMIGGSIVAISAGVIGCLVILRRMAFLGDALSHAMIAGVAGGYLFMKLAFGIEAHAPAMLLGSVIAAFMTVLLIGLVSRASRIKDDTAIGIMYIGIFALGVVIISIFSDAIHIDLAHFIMGDVLGVADSDLWIAAIACSLVLTFLILFFRHFRITTFDPVMAASIGIPVLLFDYLLTTSVSLVVVSAVSMVGVILVVGLLITPAATAYLLSDRLSVMMWLAGFFGVTSVLGGLYLCVWLDSSGGGAIMLFCTLQFFVVFLLSPKYGMLSDWLRKRMIIPQEMIEDILGALAREKKGELEMESLSSHIANRPVRLSKALHSMVQDGYIEIKGALIALTDSGKAAADKMLRAHRIWETYLHSVGTPTHGIHEQAHELEHLNEPAAIEYLDHVLGHPEVDPQGKIIPRSIEQVSGKIWLSEMICGTSGVVCSIESAVNETGLRIGDRITLGPRCDGGRGWIAIRDEEELTLTHEQADAVLIEIEAVN